MARLAWVFVVAWCCATSALPTQTDKTLVVTRVDSTDAALTGAPVNEATTNEVSVSDAVTPSVVSATEGPLAPIKISEMDVKSEVSLRYAHTAVVTRVRNPAGKAQETTFHVLLPDTAFISGFVMTLNGKPYKAYVKEKEEAKQIYNQAVSQGLGAAHIATKARDSNQFSVSVNVEPKTEALFNLTYEELLQRRNGIYNHAINLHPRTLVPKLTVTVHIKEGTKITTLRVPELRTGNEIDATENDPQNKNVKIDKSDDEKEATITFTPNLDEQKKMMEIYAEKSKQSKSDRPYNFFGEESKPTETVEGNLGQFVVQYDVERPNDGEILVNNGYFVHFFAPAKLPPLNKHVVFVLDTSGSMMGRKIDQLKEAMISILSELNPGDYFHLVEFSFDEDVHDLKEAELNETRRPPFRYWDRPEKKATNLVPPAKATKENIEKAKIIVNRLEASGGTNINDALTVAIQLITKGIQSSSVESENKTDATKTSTTTERKDVEKPSGESEESSKLQPIIIFLTDGEPTVGNTNTQQILSQVSEKNFGYQKAAIFSLAFGEDADRTFLRKLSLQNDAFMRHIYEAADAALQLRDFYKQVSSPLLSDVRFVYPADQVKDDSVTKHRFHSYYGGSEVVVAGKIEDEQELTPEVLAFCGVDDSYTRKKYRVVPKITNRKSDVFLPLERLWAYLTIKQLLDESDATDKKVDEVKKEETPDKKALKIALKYEFVTPLTSLVVVKPNATSAVDAEPADKPDNAFYDSGRPLSNAPLPLFASFAAGAPAPPSAFADSFIAHDEVADLNVEEYDIVEDRGPEIGQNALFSSHKLSAATGAVVSPYYTTRRVAFGAPGPANFFQYITSTPASVTIKQNRRDRYRLNEFLWVEDLLKADSDALQITVNGTITSLKLSTDEASDPVGEGQECEHDVSGGGLGVCTYLVRCDAAKTITAQDYNTKYCDLNGFAGVCCPKKTT